MSIGYQSDQGVVTLTIDRPAKKNAITGEMYETFVAHLKQAAADKSVRAVLITGAGNAFTAGNDLKDFGDPRFIQPDSPVLGFMQALAAFEKPMVVAVNGLAVGIGANRKAVYPYYPRARRKRSRDYISCSGDIGSRPMRLAVDCKKVAG